MAMITGVVLFKDFQTLDVFGPVEVLGRLKDLFSIKFFSQSGGLVENEHGVSIMTEKMGAPRDVVDVLIIPGGHGTRTEINNEVFLNHIRRMAELSRYTLTVCTGSALLAKTGLLDGRKATSNKRAFDWVVSNGNDVAWVREARWTADGKYYTSSGVSAGIDMTLGFLSDLHGRQFATDVANQVEFNWQEDKDVDNFANILHG
ncbi:MAG TPA: DJ-1/PfpI family protein [Chitinophagaceae bacterium]|jgi:putative intracellular protease/amidase|nr:DJ-1/PfpI family protein [Chitinophagaceae bacterium]